MIAEIAIRDLGVIESATLPLGAGFTAITGETGAGKTMVVHALGLLTGGRADAGAVRAGAERARIAGAIATADERVLEIVREAGGEIEEGELLVSRTVTAQGRSTASVGGVRAPAGVLSRLAERLVTIHGQSEQLRLGAAGERRRMLDAYAGRAHLRLVAEHERVFLERERVARRLQLFCDESAKRFEEAEVLRERLSLLEKLQPVAGEDVALAQQIQLLGNTEALREGVALALQALTEEGEAGVCAAGLLAAAVNALERAAALDDRFAACVETVRAAGFQVQDAALQLGSYAAQLEAGSEAQLEHAHDRLAALKQAMRDAGTDLDGLIDLWRNGEKRLFELDSDSQQRDMLQAQEERLAAETAALAQKLSRERRAAAVKLTQQLNAELRALALGGASIQVTVTGQAHTKTGVDEVDFLLAAHPGQEPRPIAKGASGGELSRVMLAFEVVTANVSDIHSFVFDEVDQGVGGAAALEIAKRLARLAATAQVIVVTHLAQLAAFADNHVLVQKSSDGKFTASSLTRLVGVEREREVARLLSGMSDSVQALAHARELLTVGTDFRGKHPLQNKQ